MKQFYLLLVIIVFFFSCSNSHSTLFDEINQRADIKEDVPFKLDLKTVITEKWDKMYAFNSLATIEIIDSALGFNYPFYTEFSESLVFVKDDKVVFHEDVPLKFDGIDPKGGGLDLHFPFFYTSKKYYEVESKDAVFSVNRSKNSYGEQGFYFTPLRTTSE